MSPAARKYIACFLVGLRQARAERAALIGRSLFLVIILVVFSRLWGVLREEGMLAAGNAADLLWYLALTEWIALSVPMSWRPINEDVRSGDIAYRLARPIPYVAYRFADAVGRFVPHWLLSGVVAFLAAFLLAGSLPSDPRGLLIAVPLSFVAGCVLILFWLWIGLLAFWMQDANPAYFVFQKFLFILGGLILPLSIYPLWLQRLADWTPFPAMLFGVGRSAFGWDLAAHWDTVWRLGVSAVAACVLISWTSSRARRSLLVNGG